MLAIEKLKQDKYIPILVKIQVFSIKIGLSASLFLQNLYDYKSIDYLIYSIKQKPDL